MLGFHKQRKEISEGVKYVEDKYGVTPQPVNNPSQRLYCIYDIAEAKYKPPFVATTDLSARRVLSEAINTDKNSMISKYSNEYNLCCLGTFDDDIGLIGAFSNPVVICSLFDLKEKENTVGLPSFVEKEN